MIRYKIKNSLTLISLLSLTLLITSCGSNSSGSGSGSSSSSSSSSLSSSEGTYSILDYFPLSVGFKAVIKHTYNGETKYISSYIDSTTTIDGKNAFVRKFYNQDGTLLETNYEYVDASGYYEYIRECGGWIKLYPGQFSVGDTYTFNKQCSFDSEQVDISYQVTVLGEEQVSTPLGSFPALKIKRVITYNSDSFNVQEILYTYAVKGIGGILSYGYNSEDNSDESEEVVYLEINNKTYGSMNNIPDYVITPW
ncbi:MAG: hypothetical protein ABGX26_00010 [Nautiliaceae bacterium]